MDVTKDHYDALNQWFKDLAAQHSGNVLFGMAIAWIWQELSGHLHVVNAPQPPPPPAPPTLSSEDDHA